MESLQKLQQEIFSKVSDHLEQEAFMMEKKEREYMSVLEEKLDEAIKNQQWLIMSLGPGQFLMFAFYFVSLLFGGTMYVMKALFLGGLPFN